MTLLQPTFETTEPLQFVFGITGTDKANSVRDAAKPYAKEASVLENRIDMPGSIAERIHGFEGLLTDDSKVVTVLEVPEIANLSFSILDAISLVRARILDNHFSEIVVFDPVRSHSKKLSGQELLPNDNPRAILDEIREKFPEAIIIEATPATLYVEISRTLGSLIDTIKN